MIIFCVYVCFAICLQCIYLLNVDFYYYFFATYTNSWQLYLSFSISRANFSRSIGSCTSPRWGPWSCPVLAKTAVREEGQIGRGRWMERKGLFSTGKKMQWVTISGGGNGREEELACLPQPCVSMLGNHVCVDAKPSPSFSVCTYALWGKRNNPSVVCPFPVLHLILRLSPFPPCPHSSCS